MKGFSCNKVFFLVAVIISMLCMACVNDRDDVPTAQIELGIDSNEMGMVGSDLESNMLSVSDFTSKITGSIEELKRVKDLIAGVVEAMNEQERNGNFIWNLIKDINEITTTVKTNSNEMLIGGEKIINETSRLQELTLELKNSMQEVDSQVELINDATQDSLSIATKNKESIDRLVVEVGNFKTE